MRFVLCIFMAFAAIARTGHAADASSPTSPDDPVLGSWVGTETFGAESKPIGMSFELLPKKNNMLVLFYDNPRMKFHHLGIPITRSGDHYDGPYFHLVLSADKTTLGGSKSFDGHDLPVELKRGPLASGPEPAPPAIRAATPAWTFKTGDAIWSSPSVADGSVYFGSRDGKVRALTVATGKPLWERATGGPVMGQPTVAGSYLYVPSDDGLLYKLRRRDGRVVWTFDLHADGKRELPGATSATYDSMTSAAVVVDGRVYIGSSDKNFYAIDADTGAERWHFAAQGSVRSTPAVATGRVFFGSYDHHVYALDAKNGALVWKHDTLEPVVSPMLVDRGTVYVGSRSSDLWAFDAATGAVRWKFFYWSSWVESGAVIRDGVLYIGSSDWQQVFAIDPAHGTELWRFGTGGSAWPTPAVTAGRVFVGTAGVKNYFIDHRGGFFGLERATGKPVWQFAMPPVAGSDLSGVASSPVVARGLVLFGGLDGMFYAFRADG